MNRTVLALGVGALAVLMLTGRLQAQPGASGIKVAVVNVGMVFHKYEKAQAFKGKMEKVLEPFRLQAEPLRKQMVDWSEAMKNPKFDLSKREQYERGILDNKRKLEDIEREARKAIGKEQEDQIVTLFKEMAGMVQSYAKSNQIHLVVAYGEAFEGDLFSFMNVNRKMQGMDLGGTTPLYVGPGMDISSSVADSLNSWYRTAVNTTGGTVQPVGAKQ